MKKELEKQLEENQEYKYGFTTDIDSEVIPVGLNEDVVRLISSRLQMLCKNGTVRQI